MKALDASTASAQAAALSPTSYHDFAALAALKGKAGRAGEGDAALRAAAQQFEAMFLQEMMRTMRQATIKSDLLESNAMETYEGMFDKEVAMQMSKRGGMGMADMMVKQMKKHVEGQAAMDAGGQATEPATAQAAQDADGSTSDSRGAALSAQDALRAREAAGLPLQRPAHAHDLNTETPRASIPLRRQQGYELNGPVR